MKNSIEGICDKDEEKSKKIVMEIERILGKDIEKLDNNDVKRYKNLDSETIIEIGDMYRKGTEVRRDYSKAKKLYEIAIELGDKEAYSSLAWLYAAGDGVPRDNKKARELFEEAAKCNLVSGIIGVHSTYRFVDMYKEAIDVLEDVIFRYENHNEEFDVIGSIYDVLGLAYTLDTTEKNIDKAIQCFNKALDLEYTCSYRELGDLYYYGNGVEVDLEKARECYVKSVNCSTCGEHCKNMIENIDSIFKAREQEKLRKEQKGNLINIDKSVTRFYVEYDDGNSVKDLIEKYLDKHGVYDNDSLTIGYWEEAWEENSEVQGIVETIVNNKDKFPNLKNIYFGDIDSEECEISWIMNTNLAPLINEFKIESFTVKGGTNLRFENLNSEHLKELVIISGGTSIETIKDILQGNIPNIERLEIYLGDSNYGFNGEKEDFALFSKREKFPKLKYLGLKNSEIQDEICEEIFKGDILQQLDVLDMSFGTLSDIGAKIIINNINKIKNLSEINLEYNYVSIDELIKLEKELEAIGIKYSISQEDVDDIDDEEYRAPFITE